MKVVVRSIFAIVLLLGVVELTITWHHRQEERSESRRLVGWYSHGHSVLTDVSRALQCWNARNEGPFADMRDLVASGCQFADVRYLIWEGDSAPIGTALSPDWIRIDDVTIRRAACGTAADRLPDDDVIAVLLPDAKRPFQTGVITKSGEVIWINREEWNRDRERWSERLGGVSLW